MLTFYFWFLKKFKLKHFCDPLKYGEPLALFVCLMEKSVPVRNKDSGARLHGYKSCLLCLTDGWCVVSYFTFPGLHLFCEMGKIKYLHHSVDKRIKEIIFCQTDQCLSHSLSLRLYTFDYFKKFDITAEIFLNGNKLLLA